MFVYIYKAFFILYLKIYFSNARIMFSYHLPFHNMITDGLVWKLWFLVWCDRIFLHYMVGSSRKAIGVNMGMYRASCLHFCGKNHFSDKLDRRCNLSEDNRSSYCILGGYLRKILWIVPNAGLSWVDARKNVAHLYADMVVLDPVTIFIEWK